MSTLSRRHFLAAGAAASAPLILPSRVLGQGGNPGPNDQIAIGCIGLGGMGNSHRGWMTDVAEDARVVALCDCDTQRLDAAASHYEEDEVDLYTDYRDLLDRDDIDAVVVATPDHNHAVPMVYACQAGKHVYVEKPAAKTIAAGHAMIAAAREFGRTVQVGSQGRLLERFPSICEFIRNGELGTVQEVDCWHYENREGGDAQDQEPPDHLDWDKWLGPAHWRPYNPDYVQQYGDRRYFLDFGGGMIFDRGTHQLNVMSWFLDLDDTGPTKVTATGRPPRYGNFDCPITMSVTWEFAHRDLVVHWRQPGFDPESPGQERPYGAIYHGTKGSLAVDGGDIGGRAWPLREAEEYEAPAGGFQAPRTELHSQPGLRRNWLDCIKSGEEPMMPIEAGHRIATMCTLGNIAYILGRPIEWDPENERAVNDDEANRLLLHEPGRGPWHI
ncbi:MAG: Gfo/Idh/MocA family protein [Candidatus Hydrogenedentota bacterium]